MKSKSFVSYISCAVLIGLFFIGERVLHKNETFLFVKVCRDYNSIICELLETTKALEKELNRTQIVTVTYYHPQSRGINSDSDPNNSATMRTPIPGRTIAISDELLSMGWLGGRVYISGKGVFYAEDKMGVGKDGKPLKGLRIDICASSKKQALKLGVEKGVRAVRLLEDSI